MEKVSVSIEQSCPQPSFWDTHKFEILRNTVYILVILALIILPTFKIAKVDIAHNEAWILGQKVDIIQGLGAVIVALGFFAILVIIMNLINGRVFCGWICPGGFVAEFQDKIRRKLYGPRSKKFNKITYWFVTLIVAVLFALLFFNWATDLRVFFYKTNPFFVPMWLGFIGTTAIFYFEVFIGKKWCRVFCPTGIYQKITPYHHLYKPTMVEWANLDDCGSCRACILHCPMALDPRRMAYINDFYKGIQACIACGTCIDVCKQVRYPECKEPLMVWVKELPPRDPDFIEGKHHRSKVN